MRSLRYAFRTLAKTPFVTSVAVISLALGIGANTAIFSLFDQMLLRALPVEQPGELVNLSAPGPNPGSQSCGQAGTCQEVWSYPMFRDLAREQASFTGIAAHVPFGANLALTGSTPTSGQGILVSGEYFPVLGIQPSLGRLLGPSDDERIGEHPLAVLSYDYWENNLGADPSVLNKTLVVNGYPLTIVGIGPRGFRGTTLGAEAEVFVPITMRTEMNPWWDGWEARRTYHFYLFARLKPGVTAEQATSEINAIYVPILEEVEVPLQGSMTEATMERFRNKRVVVEAGSRGQSTMHEEAGTPLRLLLGITAVVLLIACANIANLLLARGAGRAQEMAIRGSLGASRGQMLGQLLVESCLLALLGGAASLAVARWTMLMISSGLPPEATQMIDLSLSPTMIACAAILSLGTGVLFGMYPAVHSTRPDLAVMLKTTLGQPSSARAAQRFRNLLVTGQIALSMTLLVSAGLFIKSLVNVSRVDLGLDTDNIITFSISPELNGYEAERSAELIGRITEELSALPGVTSVSNALVGVLNGNSWGNDVSVEGFEWEPGMDANSRFNAVGPNYFSTLRIPLVAGREFTEADAHEAPAVAIVNEAFTRKFNLNGADAVGKYISNDGSADDELDIQIIGVVQDAKYSEVKDAPPPLFFLAARQERYGWTTFYLRTGLDPSQIISQVTPIVNRIDPNVPIDRLKTLDAQVKENVFLDRLISTLSAAFALLATILAAVGLYGVLAYTVAQRTREIGLRMALGAGQDTVRYMVLKQVGRMMAVGGIVGIAAAFALGRAAQSLLFGMEGYDAPVVGIVVVMLGMVGLGAGYIPALRASRVDPMQALRYE
jgi:predicted permease